MATRVNTKFIIGLVIVLTLMVVGGVFAVKYAKRSAEDRAREGDQARQQAIDAFAAGDTEAGNEFASKAWREYGAAMVKDRNNTQYIYKFIEAHEMFLCEDITDAENHLATVFTASRQAHNVDGATEEDEGQFYDRMMLRFRQNLVVGNAAPGNWVRHIYEMAEEDLANDESNDLARRWKGISGVYLIDSNDTLDRRSKSLDLLLASLENDPSDAEITAYIARWHITEALHLKTAAGGEVTPGVKAEYALAESILIEAFETTVDDPVSRYQMAFLYGQLPPNEDRNAQATEFFYTLADQLIASEEDRGALTTPEVSLVITVINQLAARLTGYEQADERAQALHRSTTLGDLLAADHPDQPASYLAQALGYVESKSFDQAIAALDHGLDLDTTAHATEYMLGYYARIALIQKLADVYIIAAANAEGGSARRDDLLEKAEATITRLRQHPGADSALHGAYADYLMGKLMWVHGRLDLAIQFAEAANQVQGNSSVETLRLLAKAHASPRVNNLGPAATYYERALERQPALLDRLDLVQVYLNMGTQRALEQAKIHVDAFLQQDQSRPQARLLQATIFARNGQFDVAIKIVEEMDLETYPQLISRLADYHAKNGDIDTAIELLDARLVEDPNDATAVAILFSMVTDKQERLDRLAQLRAAGMDEDRAANLLSAIENEGQMPVAEIADTIGADEDSSDLDKQKNLYRLYNQNNDLENRGTALASLVELAPNDPDVLSWQLSQALTDKDWSLADSLIDKLLELPLHRQPRVATADGRFLRAQVVTGQAGPNPDTADQSQAIALYREALEIDPSFAQGWSLLGRLLALRGDWNGAREAFEEAHTLQPSNLDSARNYGRALIQMQQADLALSIFRQLVSDHPNNQSLVNEYLSHEARYGASRVALERRLVIRDGRPDDAENLRALAILLAREERYDESVTAANRVIELEGRSRTNVQTLATIHLMAGNDDQCLSIIDGYITQRGGDCDATDYLMLAQYRLRLSKLEEAEGAFLQAIALEDQVTRIASREWAGALAAMSRHAESARLFIELLEDEPADSDALRLRLARVLIAMQNYDRAATEVMKAASSPQRELLRIEIAQQRQDTDETLRIAREAVAAHPGDATLRFTLARLLGATGDFAQATVICEGILRDIGSSPQVENYLGGLEFKTGRQDEAISRINRLMIKHPEFEPARLTLFQFYSAQYVAAPLEDATGRQDLATKAFLAFHPVVEANLENLQYLQTGGLAAYRARRYDDAARYYRAALEFSRDAQNPGPGAADLRSLFFALLDSNRNGAVIDLCEDPHNAALLASSLQLRALWARAYAQSNDWETAYSHFRSVLNECGDDHSLRIEAISVMIRATRPQEIATRYPDIIRFIEDYYGDAMSLELDLVLVNLEVTIKDFAAVITRITPHLESIEATTEEGARVRRLLAEAHQALGNVPESRALFEEALAFYPANSQGRLNTLNNLAYLLSEQTDDATSHRAAVGFAQEAADIVAGGEQYTAYTRAQILDTLGRAQFRANQHTDAAATLRQSVEQLPLVVNQMHLGQAYLAMDEMDKASIALDNANRLLRQEIAAGNQANVQYQETINQGIEQTRNNPR